MLILIVFVSVLIASVEKQVSNVLILSFQKQKPYMLFLNLLFHAMYQCFLLKNLFPQHRFYTCSITYLSNFTPTTKRLVCLWFSTIIKKDNLNILKTKSLILFLVISIGYRQHKGLWYILSTNPSGMMAAMYLLHSTKGMVWECPMALLGFHVTWLFHRIWELPISPFLKTLSSVEV